MTFQFRPAVRENVGLLIGLAGGTGSGKTFSANELATGICGGEPYAVIDTEARRALHYADRFKFDHLEFGPPFTPERYAEAIKAADNGKYKAIVVDSASHEHAGDGGLLDMHEANLQRMAGDDYKKREACNMAAWVKPKASHKAFVNKLLQIRAHLILCFRAEEKIEIVNEGGKWKAVPKKSRTGKDGWIPVCEKSLPFEMTVSFLMTDEKPGFPIPIKLQEQHRHLFPLDRPIGRDAGRALAAWAAGGLPVLNSSTIPDGGKNKQADESAAYKRFTDLYGRAEIRARGGEKELRAFWDACSREERILLQGSMEALKKLAAESDAAVSA